MCSPLKSTKHTCEPVLASQGNVHTHSKHDSESCSGHDRKGISRGTTSAVSPAVECSNADTVSAEVAFVPAEVAFVSAKVAFVSAKLAFVSAEVAFVSLAPGNRMNRGCSAAMSSAMSLRMPWL